MIQRYIYKLSQYWAIVLIIDNYNIYFLPTLLLHTCQGCESIELRFISIRLSLTYFKIDIN